MKKGFTLIELLVAAGIMLSLVSGAAHFFGQGLRTWKRSAANIERQQIASLVAERICRDIRAAQGVVAGSSSEEVILKMGLDAIGYRLINDKVRRKVNASTAYLTSENEIKTLFFFYPYSGMVKVEIDGCSTVVAMRIFR